MVIFSVLGTAKPEPRPEATSFGGVAQVYVPKTAHKWKHSIRTALRHALAASGVDLRSLPVHKKASFLCAFEFRFARPKNHYRTGKYAGQLKPWAVGLPHVGVPDLDNLVKAAKDAVGAWDKCPTMVWTDDSQVHRYIGDPRKRYADPGEEPGMTMAIMLDDEDRTG